MSVRSSMAAGQNFSPEDLDVIQRVFDEVWAEHAPNIPGNVQEAKDAIALAIINQAAEGVEFTATSREGGGRTIIRNVISNGNI